MIVLSQRGDGIIQYMIRASELTASLTALCNVDYQGWTYENTPWGRLLPSMRTAINFDRYFPPDRVRPLNEPASIRAEQNLVRTQLRPFPHGAMLLFVWTD